MRIPSRIFHQAKYASGKCKPGLSHRCLTWNPYFLPRRILHFLGGILLLPLACILAVLSVPVWAFFKFCHPSQLRSVRDFVHDHCLNAPNKYGNSPPFRQPKLIRANLVPIRVTRFACACDWCSPLTGIWCPWDECGEDGRCYGYEHLYWYPDANQRWDDTQDQDDYPEIEFSTPSHEQM